MYLESIVCLVVAVVALIFLWREKCRAFALEMEIKGLLDAAAFVVASVKNVPRTDNGSILFSFRGLAYANEEAWRARWMLWWLKRLRCNAEGTSAEVEAKELAVREEEKCMLHDLQTRQKE